MKSRDARARRWITSALVAAALPTAATHGAEPPPPSSLLLITVDTLRPDALGWVAGRNPTPAIDRLAAAGYRFTGAISPVALTLPAHASMLTGRIPRRHGIHDNGHVLPEDVTVLAELLRDRGWSTAAFVSGYPLRAQFGLDRGFEVYDDALPVGPEGWTERPAMKTTEEAVGWLESARRPWFLWVHYYDPHDPYDPPREFWAPGPRGAYDGEVAYTDAAIGRLLEAATARAGGPPLTVFTADHGESFGEHGENGHGYFIYDSTILVPLVFHWPGRIEPGQGSSAPRLVDLLPTVLELLGQPPVDGVDGVSLAAALAGEDWQTPPAYLECRQPWIAYGWSPLSGLRDGRWKLIEAPRPELYDLANDPGELNNLIAERPAVAEDMMEKLHEIEGRSSTEASAVDEPEVVARLRALGYLSSGGSDAEPPPGLPDPKDRIHIHRRLGEAEALLRKGRYQDAVQAFKEVLDEDPDNRFGVLRSGIARLKQGRYDEAIVFLDKAVRLDPEQAEAAFAYADALSRSGRLERSIPYWQETVRLQPRREAAWSNLGTVYVQLGRWADAIAAYRRAVAIEPEDPVLLRNLAIAESRGGRFAQAAEHFLAAAEIEGESFGHSASLGMILLELERIEEALPWLRRSRPGEAEFSAARLELARVELRRGGVEQARAAIAEALSVDPALAARLENDPELAGLLGSAAGE